MTKHKAAAIVLAAGLGTRMESDRPKVLHSLAGRPMIHWLLDTIAAAGIDDVTVVIPDGDAGTTVAGAVVPLDTVVQADQLGTGHAVRCVCDAGGVAADDVLVLFGADPLITPATMRRLIKARRAKSNPAVVVLGFRPNDAGNYGRLIVADDGSLDAIIEARDGTQSGKLQ